MKNMTKLHNILKDFFILIEIEKNALKNRKIGRRQTFNFFQGIVNDKLHLEKYHTNFLYYLLNPHGNHGCEDLFLREFLSLLTFQLEQISFFSLRTVNREYVLTISLSITILALCCTAAFSRCQTKNFQKTLKTLH